PACDFFRCSHQRTDWCGESTRQMDCHPGRRKQEQQCHQAQRRHAEQADLALSLQQMLVFPLRTGNRVVDVSVAQTLRHEYQTRPARKWYRNKIESFAVRDKIDGTLLATL